MPIPRLNRKFLRFSLRGFLLVTTLFAILLGREVNRARVQAMSAEHVRKLGGGVSYDFQFVAAGTTIKPSRGYLTSIYYVDDCYIESARHPVPDWLQKYVDENLFVRVERVSIETRMGDIGFLAGFPDLRELSLCSSTLVDADLRVLAKLKNLRKLKIQSANITGAGLRHLEGCRRLEELSLSGSGVTSVGIKAVTLPTSLRKVDFAWTDIDDAGLIVLEPLKNLESLLLGQTNVAGPGLRFLSNHPKLERLRLDQTKIGDSPSLSALAALPNLKYLSLQSCRMSDDGIVYLKELSQLEVLKMPWIRDDSISVAAARELDVALMTTSVEYPHARFW